MRYYLKLSAAIFFVITSCVCYAGEVQMYDLKTCQLENPLAVDRPIFSWKTVSVENGFSQTSYQIEVASSKERLNSGMADVWQSGVVVSDKQFNIEMPSDALTYGKKYFWRVRVQGENGGQGDWSEPAYFLLGPTTAEWEAEWITADWEQCKTTPYFRKEFQTLADGEKPQSAIIYLSGLGCSDLYLNGNLVDRTRLLDPAQTNYEQYAFYSAFDVSDLLQSGRNSVGILLGDGWYNQDGVWGPGFTYGKPIVTMQMEMRYGNGSKKTISTDQTWEWINSPLIRSNIYTGEIYDARAEAEFKKKMVGNEGWSSAIKASGTIPDELFPQLIEPIRMQEEHTAIDIRQDPSGNWIFDFGVNIAGIPEIRVEQPAGTRLKMRMGETLHDDGSVNFSTTGVAATGAVQTEEYVCSGTGVEVWNPRFTYHGFRYLELSGAVSKPDASWVKAIAVRTDVKPTGHFKCSNDNMNILHEMAIRTLSGNIHGIPTDCPHREKCGWLGDAHAIGPFTNCNFGMYNFWMKYLEDIKSTSSSYVPHELFHKLHNEVFYHTEKQPGIPYMIAPGKRLCGAASPDWGTAIVQLPWQVYLYYGSEEPLSRHYGQMKQWVEHIEGLCVDGIVPFGLGDWCPPGGNSLIDCPIELSSTAYHYIDASIMQKVVEILGYNEDSAYFAALCARIKTAFNEKFFDRQSASYGSHTANAMAIGAGLSPDGYESAISDAIVRDMTEKYNGFIHTGIFGLGHIAPALSRYGNSAAAYEVFAKKGENSFAFMWEGADATTLWETLPVNGQSKDMALKHGISLNHPMQGVYDAWFYEDVAGIRPDPKHPGFKRIIFNPSMTDHIEWAEGTIETPYGEARSSWKTDAKAVEWEISIPANASGLVVLPDRGKAYVNGKKIGRCREISRIAGEERTYQFPSGEFEITINKKK